MRPAPSPRARGTSLLELMVSMAVLSIGILGVLQMSTVASAQNAVAGRTTATAWTGRDLVDAVDRLPWNHPALAAVDGTPTELVLFDAEKDTYTMDWKAAAPLLSAAPAILQADRHAGNAGGIKRVWFTVTLEKDVDGNEIAKHVQITVRMAMPGSQPRDHNFWTVKYNPTHLVGGVDNFQEI